MTTLRTAAQQALEALEDIADEVFSPYDNKLGDAILALRAALAEPVQEPVAWTLAKESPEEQLFDYEEWDRQKREEFTQLMALDESLQDDDGYPTNHALLIIEKWRWDDPKGWFKFIENMWYLRSRGWREEDTPHWLRESEMVHQYLISTGGWSGNESIIRAMMKNNMLWNNTWVQSRRGGHYIFEVERDEVANT